jgi:hypothetical protein
VAFSQLLNVQIYGFSERCLPVALAHPQDSTPIDYYYRPAMRRLTAAPSPIACVCTSRLCYIRAFRSLLNQRLVAAFPQTMAVSKVVCTCHNMSAKQAERVYTNRFKKNLLNLGIHEVHLYLQRQNAFNAMRPMLARLAASIRTCTCYVHSGCCLWYRAKSP